MVLIAILAIARACRPWAKRFIASSGTTLPRISDPIVVSAVAGTGASSARRRLYTRRIPNPPHARRVGVWRDAWRPRHLTPFRWRKHLGLCRRPGADAARSSDRRDRRGRREADLAAGRHSCRQPDAMALLSCHAHRRWRARRLVVAMQRQPLARDGRAGRGAWCARGGANVAEIERATVQPVRVCAGDRRRRARRGARVLRTRRRRAKAVSPHGGGRHRQQRLEKPNRASVMVDPRFYRACAGSHRRRRVCRSARASYMQGLPQQGQGPVAMPMDRSWWPPTDLDVGAETQGRGRQGHPAGPADSVPAERDQQTRKLTSRRGVITPIIQNEPICCRRSSTSPEAGSRPAAGDIPPGLRACRFGSTKSSASPGYVLPGTRVDVARHREPPSASRRRRHVESHV